MHWLLTIYQFCNIIFTICGWNGVRRPPIQGVWQMIIGAFALVVNAAFVAYVIWQLYKVIDWSNIRTLVCRVVRSVACVAGKVFTWCRVHCPRLVCAAWFKGPNLDKAWKAVTSRVSFNSNKDACLVP
eukprot:GHRR01002948.1.p2 GENE.GHRR01002948.1~~GHRR01002948.1.p2  ORF type:complete len:128 (-),score=21.89 GHRR01002948.1:1980-2363(-)